MKAINEYKLERIYITYLKYHRRADQNDVRQDNGGYGSGYPQAGVSRRAGDTTGPGPIENDGKSGARNAQNDQRYEGTEHRPQYVIHRTEGQADEQRARLGDDDVTRGQLVQSAAVVANRYEAVSKEHRTGHQAGNDEDYNGHGDALAGLNKMANSLVKT